MKRLQQQFLQVDKILALILFICCIAWNSISNTVSQEIRHIPPVPSNQNALRYHSGEPAVLARILAYWLQTFEQQSGRIVHYDELNYDNLIDWFAIMQKLEPDSSYTLLVATHLFTQAKDNDKVRLMLTYVHQQFLQAPHKHWRWMAYCAVIAKHRLNDKSLALQYAQDLNYYNQDKSVPYWVRDMEFLLLAELGEKEAAVALVSAMLDTGDITDPRELQFLTRQLERLSPTNHGKTE